MTSLFFLVSNSYLRMHLCTNNGRVLYLVPVFVFLLCCYSMRVTVLEKKKHEIIIISHAALISFLSTSFLWLRSPKYFPCHLITPSIDILFPCRFQHTLAQMNSNSQNTPAPKPCVFTFFVHSLISIYVCSLLYISAFYNSLVSIAHNCALDRLPQSLFYLFLASCMFSITFLLFPSPHNHCNPHRP